MDLKEESLPQSNHWVIVTLVLTVLDKFSETRLVIEFWRDSFGYAIAFVATMGLSATLNLVLIGRFVMRHQSDSALKLYLRKRRSTVSGIFMLSLLKFDLMQVHLCSWMTKLCSLVGVVIAVYAAAACTPPVLPFPLLSSAQ